MDRVGTGNGVTDQSISPTKRAMNPNRPFAAAGFVLLAMLLIGFIDNYVVIIAAEAGLWQFHFTRTLMVLPMILGLAALGFGALRPRRLGAVAARSFFVSTAMVIYFGALAFLPIAEVAAGLFTSPIFVLILSALFLGERIGGLRGLAAVLGFGGVLMVLRPDAGSFSVLAAVPVMAGLFYAVSAIATRSWCADESALTLLMGFFVAMGVWGALGVALLAAFPQEAAPGPEGFILRGLVAPSGPFLFWTFVQAVGSVVAVGFIIRGYQSAEASFVAIFEYSLLIFVAAWAYVLRGETLDVWAQVGIAIIIVSGVLIAMGAHRVGSQDMVEAAR